MDYLELIARVTSHIPDKGQVMVRYYGLYANAPIHLSPGVDVRRGEAVAGFVFEQPTLMTAEERLEYE
jgi:hypothetical protein